MVPGLIVLVLLQYGTEYDLILTPSRTELCFVTAGYRVRPCTDFQPYRLCSVIVR